MKIRQFLRFPGFLDKAVALSYDDGSLHDIRFAAILQKYGLKCTFNYVSGWMPEEDAPGRRRLCVAEAKEILRAGGHEPAVHGKEHLSLASVPADVGMADILLDRLAHERRFGTVVRGMAYANGSCGGQATEIVRAAGIEHARTIHSTERFEIPEDWLNWNPTAHHRNPRLSELVDAFFAPSSSGYYWAIHPKLFTLWGHSHEFAENDNWEIIENFGKKIGGREDVYYATVGEIYAYVTAYDALRFSLDGTRVTNPTATDIYLNYYRENVLVPAGATVDLPFRQLY